MASFTTSAGVRILSGSSAEAVESAVNTFLAGDGTTTNRRKQVIQAPQFVISGGTYYVLLTYIEFGN